MKAGKVQDIRGVIEKGLIVSQVGMRIRLPLSVIERNLGQPRKYFNEQTIARMAETYKEEGDVDQPIGVSLKADKRSVVIVYGERRYRAAIMAELPSISCFLLQEMTEFKLYKKSLRENICREDMSPVEQALSFKRIMDEEGCGVPDFSEEFGLHPSFVWDCLRYLNLHERIQDMVIHRKMEKGVAKLLAAYEKNDQLKFIGLLKEEAGKKGRPLHPNEALLVIRKSAEKSKIRPRPGGKGSKQKTFAELVASNFYRAAINLAKNAKSFQSLSKEQLAALISPSGDAIGEQLIYVESLIKEVKKRLKMSENA